MIPLIENCKNFSSFVDSVFSAILTLKSKDKERAVLVFRINFIDITKPSITFVISD